MATWTVQLATAQGVRRSDLPAKSIRVGWDLDGPATATLTVDGLHPATKWILPLASDVLLYRDGRLMFRGRLGHPDDDIDVDGHGVSVPAFDYREILDRRILWPGSRAAFGGVDQADIVWALIADTQALPGGDLSISQGVGSPTGRVRDRLYPVGKTLGETITQLSDVIDGFDFEVDANLAANIYYPRRGRGSVVFVAHKPTTIRSIRRTADTADYTNALRHSGADGLAAVTRQVAGLATRAEGRWEAQLGDPDITTAGTLAEKADGALTVGSELVPSYTATLQPGKWTGPDDLWLGDTTRLLVRSGRLDIDTLIRVHQMGISVDGDGDETVTVTFGRPPRSWMRFWRHVANRLTNLNRR